MYTRYGLAVAISAGLTILVLPVLQPAAAGSNVSSRYTIVETEVPKELAQQPLKKRKPKKKQDPAEDRAVQAKQAQTSLSPPVSKEAEKRKAKVLAGMKARRETAGPVASDASKLKKKKLKFEMFGDAEVIAKERKSRKVAGSTVMRQARQTASVQNKPGIDSTPLAEAQSAQATALAQKKKRLAIEAARRAEVVRKVQEEALALKKRRLAEAAAQRAGRKKAADVAPEAIADQAANTATQLAETTSNTVALPAATETAGGKQEVSSIDVEQNSQFSNGANEKPNDCQKAQSIIGKYKFLNVKSKSCEGEIYHFIGTRAGKTFSIKIRVATWELTEIAGALSGEEE
jgi:hypothetical protein